MLMPLKNLNRPKNWPPPPPPAQSARLSRKPLFRASIQPGGALELLVYEDIGENWFGEGVTAKTVKQSIDQAGTFTSISLRINSPGGDAHSRESRFTTFFARRRSRSMCSLTASPLRPPASSRWPRHHHHGMQHHDDDSQCLVCRNGRRG